MFIRGFGVYKRLELYTFLNYVWSCLRLGWMFRSTYSRYGFETLIYNSRFWFCVLRTLWSNDPQCTIQNLGSYTSYILWSLRMVEGSDNALNCTLMSVAWASRSRRPSFGCFTGSQRIFRMSYVRQSGLVGMRVFQIQ